MANTGFRFREQLPSIEADEINLLIGIEESEVFEVKKEMVQKMIRVADGTSRKKNV